MAARATLQGPRTDCQIRGTVYLFKESLKNSSLRGAQRRSNLEKCLIFTVMFASLCLQ